MKSYKLKEGVYWVGTIDYDLKVFDIVMYTEFGSTYNSYIVKGSEKQHLLIQLNFRLKMSSLKELKIL